jgi:hypothetical protein
MLNTFLIMVAIAMLGRVLLQQGRASRKETIIVKDLDQVLADIADESTQIGSLAVLTASLKQQLADALSGTTLPPGVQDKIDAVFAGVEANKAKIVDAINLNTPVAPPEPVPA